MKFYQTKSNDHGLPHDPFKALISPRPIGWISTRSRQGIDNLAPYSFFNAVCADPHMVMFASNGSRDSVQNVRETGEFVVNLAGFDQADAINRSAAKVALDEDEFPLAGVDKLPGRLVAPMRAAGAPAHLECVLFQLVDLPGSPAQGENTLVIGTVIGVHIDEQFLTGGRFDCRKAGLLSRLGYADYSIIESVFEMKRR